MVAAGGREGIATHDADLARPSDPVDRPGPSGWLAAMPGADARRARSCSTPRRTSSRRPAAARTSSSRPAGTSRPWASPSGRSRPGPTGSTTPGCSTCSGCRARGWSWPGWPGPGACRVVLSPICWYRAAGARRAGDRARSSGLATWRSGRAHGALAPRGRAGGASCSGWPTRSCPTRGPRRGSSSGSSAPTRRRIRVVPNGVEPRFADADARALPRPPRRRTTSSSTSAGSSRGRTSWG